MASFIKKHYELITSRWNSGDGKEIVHDGVISGATGMAFGYAAAHSKNDLEFTVARKHIPLDFAASIGGLVASLTFGGKATRDVVRQASVAGLAISSYRATEKYIHLHGGPKRVLVSGKSHPAIAAHAGERAADIAEDPILAAAAAL